MWLRFILIAALGTCALPQALIAAPEKKKVVAPPELAAPLVQQTEEAPEKFRPWPLVASIFPGVILHGSGQYVAGNYKAARDLIITEGVSIILVLAVGAPAFATGNAAVLVPGVYTIGFVGVTHFFTSWAADFYGSSGLNLISSPLVHPHQRTWIAAGIIRQDDTESDIYGLYRFDGKFARENWYVRGLFDIEEKRMYQNFGLDTGYRVLRPKWADLYTSFEGRHERSAEGFSLTSLNALAEFTLYPENLTSYYAKSLRGIGIFTTVGIGRQYIHLRDTPDFRKDAHFANLVLMHGVRFRATRFTEFSSAFNFRKDNILGGASILGGTFVHQVEIFLGNFFTRITLEHGRGYRLFALAGVNW